MVLSFTDLIQDIVRVTECVYIVWFVGKVYHSNNYTNWVVSIVQFQLK